MLQVFLHFECSATLLPIDCEQYVFRFCSCLDAPLMCGCPCGVNQVCFSTDHLGRVFIGLGRRPAS
jgi:hypothetical protein